MRVDLVMPQMGESIAEGTITRWIKSVGDTVERDEPIFEISTDKVDAEIPSPAAGTLIQIKSQEGETVPINEVVAVIETDADAAASAAAPGAEKPSPKEEAVSAPAATPAPAPPATQPPAAGTARFVSPVVRRIADEHGIDPSSVPGTGSTGRVTKKDILAFIASGAATAATAPAAASAPVATPGPAPAAPRVGPPPVTFGPGADTIREPLSVMRKKIAEHMIDSQRTSAHVQSLFEVDMTHCAKLRVKHNQWYVDRHGVKLSYMAFVIKAVCDALRSWPILNSSLEGNDVIYKKNLNLGIAVALDWGLIVPVVHNADHLSIAGLSAKVHDLANRARGKQLKPEEVQGGTFTITNPGQFGGLFGLPIINQPQVAILGLGGIKKRPVVINDAIAIRSMMYLSMSYDHRVVDGAGELRRIVALVPKDLSVCWLGRVGYRAGLVLQERLVDARRRDRVGDTLVLLEHPPVITLGRSSDPAHVLHDAETLASRGIELHEIGRGGDVTYHGPGQLVGYPVIRLEGAEKDAHAYLRNLEQGLIGVAGHYGIEADRIDGLTGIWVGNEKLAAIGVHLSTGWITSHGFALNVTTDLDGFSTIVPCGIREHGVTSLARLLERSPSLEQVAAVAAGKISRALGRRAGSLTDAPGLPAGVSWESDAAVPQGDRP